MRNGSSESNGRWERRQNGEAIRRVSCHGNNGLGGTWNQDLGYRERLAIACDEPDLRPGERRDPFFGLDDTAPFERAQHLRVVSLLVFLFLCSPLLLGASDDSASVSVQN